MNVFGKKYEILNNKDVNNLKYITNKIKTKTESRLPSLR